MRALPSLYSYPTALRPTALRRTVRRSRLPLALDLIGAGLLGGLHSLPFVHTGLWWLQLLVVACLAWQAAAQPPWRAAAVGLTFGTAWLASATWWLFISLHTYGGLPAWLTVLAIGVLSALLSLYLAAGLAIFARWRSGSGWRDALLFGAVWLLAELARGVIFTGFPWAASGYAHVDGPLAVLAPWLGVYGLGCIGAVLAAWPVLGALSAGRPEAAASLSPDRVPDRSSQRLPREVAARTPTEASAETPHATSRSSSHATLHAKSHETSHATPHAPSRRAAAPPPGRRFALGGAPARIGVPIFIVVGLLVCARLVGPGRFTEATGTLTVTLLQSNVAQDEKFALDRMPQALAWTHDELLAARGDLVIGPETVIPLLPGQLDPLYWRELTQHFEHGAQAALFGIPLGDADAGYTNSAVGLSAGARSLRGSEYRYDKHHLVPFGEFVPPGFRWFTELMNIPLGDFNRGSLVAPSFLVHGERIGANICYEDLFGEELAARFSELGDAPTIFANISNIGWFGDTIAIDQHLQISRMRTLELQRPTLRSTNTGATAVIDHHGRVTAALPRFTQGVLEAQVQGRTGLTPFTMWASRWGLWPLVVASALVLIWRIAPRLRRPIAALR